MKKKHKVVLTFDTFIERDYFLGQLSDGWGENMVDLHYPRKKNLKEADEIHVKHTNSDYWPHALKCALKYPREGWKSTEIRKLLEELKEDDEISSG